MNTLYKQFETDAKQWVEEAGKILIKQEHSFTIAKQKGDLDFATSADIEVESFLIKNIRNKYPNHGIYSEESEPYNAKARYVWIIDPLDCTKEYAKGAGEYNVLLALEAKGNVVAGVIKRFGHDITYYASLENGAHMGNARISVSKTSTLSSSFIGFNMPNKIRHMEREIDQYMRIIRDFLKSAFRIRAGFDDAKMFAWVAQGVYDGAISLPNTCKWFDVAPAMILIHEAGGKVSDWEGHALKNHDLSKGIIASNGILHEQLLHLVSSS